jgi:hypothetical protein
MTAGILKLLALAVALRTEAREEGMGLDVSQHGEEAYARDEGAILLLPDPPERPLVATTQLGAALASEGGRS